MKLFCCKTFTNPHSHSFEVQILASGSCSQTHSAYVPPLAFDSVKITLASIIKGGPVKCDKSFSKSILFYLLLS